MKIFGREPALVIGFIGAVLTALAGFNLDILTPGAVTAIVALLTSAVTAWATRPIAPALFTGVLTAAVALVAEYGLHVSGDLVTGLSAVILAGFALFAVRPQVSPLR